MDSSSDPQASTSALKGPRHRHMARSAAKRESVQLLGSIKDLQAHFARAGLVEHRPGAGVGVKGSSNLGAVGEDEEGNAENKPVKDERRRERKMWKEVELPKVDPVSAKREARMIVGSMRNTWVLQPPSPSSSSAITSSPSSWGFPTAIERTTRTVLVSTAQSIRTIRTLALAISDAPRPTERRVSSSSQLLPRPGSKLRTSFSTPSRPAGMPRAVSLGAPERKSSLGVVTEGPQEDLHADLRKAAIEVLACLRALEERLRIDATELEEEEDEPRHTESPVDTLGDSYADTPLISYRPPSAGSDRLESYYEDEEEYNLNALALADSEKQHMVTWEERIVREDRSYQPIESAATEQVKDSVSRWIRVVERIFHVSKNEGTEVESWVRAEEWVGRAQERLQTFLTSYLPLQLQLLKPSTADAQFAAAFLPKISDGFVLIHAFNALVHCSRKPWGFVPEEDIHDTASSDASEGEESKEWTFRRIGNLTCFGAALRHRYNLPISMPTSDTASLLPKPSTVPSRSAGPNPNMNPTSTSSLSSSAAPSAASSRQGVRLDFDPSLVAKKGEGWEKMLENLLMRWMEEAASETLERQAVLSST